MLKPISTLPIACMLMLSACSYERANRIMYATPAANVDYLTQKGDAKITAYYSANAVTDNIYSTNPSYKGITIGGADVHAAYAVTDHWRVLAGYSYKVITQSYVYDTTKYYGGVGIFAPPRTQTNIFDSSLIKYNSSFFQIGAGYSIPLNAKKSITYNLYGGIDFGKLTVNDAGLNGSGNPYTRYYAVNTTKPWLQGAFNFGNARTVLNCSFGGRFSLLHFSDPTTTYLQQELHYFYLDKIAGQTYFFWEPYFDVQVRVPGLKWLKIDAQLSLSNGSNNYYPKVSTVNGSIGVTVNVMGTSRGKSKTGTGKIRFLN